MKVVREILTIRTERAEEFTDITKRIRDVVGRSAIRDGVLVVNSLHTTFALFVNEFQRALIDDLGVLLQKLVPRRDGYTHDDPRYSDCDRANGHAHLRTMLLGRSVSLPVQDGEPVLGQYQSILAAEMDGPRARSIGVLVMGQ